MPCEPSESHRGSSRAALGSAGHSELCRAGSLLLGTRGRFTECLGRSGTPEECPGWRSCSREHLSPMPGSDSAHTASLSYMHAKPESTSAQQDPGSCTIVAMSFGAHGIGTERMRFSAGHESLHEVRCGTADSLQGPRPGWTHLTPFIKVAGHCMASVGPRCLLVEAFLGCFVAHLQEKRMQGGAGR